MRNPAGLAIVPETTGPELEESVLNDAERIAFFAKLMDYASGPNYSEHTRRAYKRACKSCFAWLLLHRKELSRTNVMKWLAEKRREEGWSSATMNQYLVAIKNVVENAAWAKDEHGRPVMPASHTWGILRIKGQPKRKTRMGNWLSFEDSRKLLASINIAHEVGLRDLVAIGLMVGAGLRRHEVARVRFEQIRRIGSREDGKDAMAIVDLMGKFSFLRTVPLEDWVYTAIEMLRRALNVREGYVIRPAVASTRLAMHPRDRQVNKNLVEAIVKKHCGALGWLWVRPHDLRRTFAQLAKAGGAPIDEIQQTLGHISVATTELYLNTSLNIPKPASSYIPSLWRGEGQGK